MTNPFRSVLALGYGPDDQGKDSATFVVLSLAADLYDSDPNHPAFAAGTPLADPYAEALRLIGHGETHYIKQLAQELPVR